MLKRLGESLRGWEPANAARLRDPLVLLGAIWGEIVGDDIARCSHPTRAGDDGTLLITTRSSAWSQQLSLLAETILVKVNARIAPARVTRLRFRVGRLPTARAAVPSRPGASAAAPAPRTRPQARPPAASLEEAVARFRATTTTARRAKRASGWKECRVCGTLVPPPGSRCVRCENDRALGRGRTVARLLFEAPWLGYVGTAALVDGLTREEYETDRRRALSRWWQVLLRAKAAGRLSRDRRERSIASSYVLLASGLSPEEIVPATLHNILGDELHDLIYGTE